MTDSNIRPLSDYQNEREAFGAWAKSVIESDPQQWPLMGGHDGEDYWAYMGWQARAALDVSRDKIASLEAKNRLLFDSDRRNEDQLVRIAACVGRDASGAPEHDRTIAGAAIDEITRLRTQLAQRVPDGWRQHGAVVRVIGHGQDFRPDEHETGEWRDEDGVVLEFEDGYRDCFYVSSLLAAAPAVPEQQKAAQKAEAQPVAIRYRFHYPDDGSTPYRTGDWRYTQGPWEPVPDTARDVGALYTAQPKAVPLTDHAAFSLIDSMGWSLDDTEKDDMLKLLRATEAAHDIGTGD